MRSAVIGPGSSKVLVAMVRHRLTDLTRSGQVGITIRAVSGRVGDVLRRHRRKVMNSAPLGKPFWGKNGVALAWVDRGSLLTRAGR